MSSRIDRFAGRVHWKITEADYGQAVTLLGEEVSIAPADDLIHFQLFATDETGKVTASLGTWLTADDADRLAQNLRACAVKSRANQRFPNLFRKNRGR